MIVTPVIYRDDIKVIADQLYNALRAAGIDALLDDREERPGIKFKDADLIGIPFRIVIGRERIKEGRVELFSRATRKTTLVDIESVVSYARSLVTEGLAGPVAQGMSGKR